MANFEDLVDNPWAQSQMPYDAPPVSPPSINDIQWNQTGQTIDPNVPRIPDVASFLPGYSGPKQREAKMAEGWYNGPGDIVPPGGARMYSPIVQEAIERSRQIKPGESVSGSYKGSGGLGLSELDRAIKVARETPGALKAIDDEMQPQLQEKHVNLINAQDELYKTQAAGAAARAQRLGDYANAANRITADYQKKESDALQRVADIESAHDQAMAEKMSKTVDPQHFWKNDKGEKNIGKIIGSAIAMGLSAFGSSLTRGQNTAMMLIDQAIERDIGAQKIELEKAGQKVRDIESSYGMARQHYTDLTAAKEAAKADEWGKVKVLIDQTMANTESEVAKKNGAIALAYADQKQAESKLAARQAQIEAERTAAFQVADLGVKKAQLGMQQAQFAASMEAKNAPRGPDADFIKELQSYDSAIADIDELSSDYERYIESSGTLTSENSKDFQNKVDLKKRDMIQNLHGGGKLKQSSIDEESKYLVEPGMLTNAEVQRNKMKNYRSQATTRRTQLIMNGVKTGKITEDQARALLQGTRQSGGGEEVE